MLHSRIVSRMRGSVSVATSDFLVNGGGEMSALWSPVAREDLPILLRDVYLRYLERMGTVTPALEGRIRVADDTDSSGGLR